MNIYKIAITSLLPLAILPCKSEDKKKPNILFLLMDDLGYGDLGIMGQQYIETPNIDRLAQSGKILSQHYSGSPVSAPSRCVLMTGLHTGHAQIRGNDEFASRGNVWSHESVLADSTLEGQRPMAANTITLAHHLRNGGYTTACIGKWGLGSPGSVSEPNEMGFDLFFGYNCQRQAHTYYPTHLYKNKSRVYLENEVLQHGRKLAHNDNPFAEESYKNYTQNDYSPNLMFEETLTFIEENSDRPFFLWWTTPLPHVSLQAPKRLVDYYVEKFGDEVPFLGDLYFPCRYPRATYAAMITYVDEQVGQIIQKLKDENVYDNTIIVFTSDNGPTFNGGTDSPWFDSAKPFCSLRGWGKCSLMEGGIRVPTIVSWSGKISGGTKSSILSAFQDWLPTLLDMAGLSSLVPDHCDGISLKNVLTNSKEQQEHDYLYWEYPESGGSIAVRQENWKLIVKNIRVKPEYYLYDLANDLLEENNVAEENNDIMTKLINLARQSHTTPTNYLFKMGLPL